MGSIGHPPSFVQLWRDRPAVVPRIGLWPDRWRKGGVLRTLEFTPLIASHRSMEATKVLRSLIMISLNRFSVISQNRQSSNKIKVVVISRQQFLFIIQNACRNHRISHF